MTTMRFAPLAIALPWTRPPAVVRQCVFVFFRGVALEGGLKGGAVGYFQNLAYSCWFSPTLPAQALKGVLRKSFKLLIFEKD